MIKADRHVRARLQKCIAVTVVSALFFNTVAFATTTQPSVWSDRRHSREGGNPGTLESIHPRMSADWAPASAGETLTQFGLVRETFNPSGHPQTPLLIIQDVHLNTEAQSNIVQMLSLLRDQDRLGTVGVEGAFVPFDFRRFFEAGDRQNRMAVADEFLAANRIGAPSYIGVTAAELPENFIGVDDEALYDANLRSYLAGFKNQARLIADLNEQKQSLTERKRRVFNAALRKLDLLVESYRDGRIGLGALLEKIPVSQPTAHRFLEAVRLEKKIDFARAEREKKAVIEKLARVLTAAEATRLAELRGSSELSAVLSDLLNRHSIPLAGAPAFEAYLRYSSLSSGINAEDLIRESNEAIAAALNAQVRTPVERRLLKDSREADSTSKLLQFALTPDEWSDRQHGLFAAGDLRPFEDFYRYADLRSEKIIRNFLAAVSARDQRTNVLVIGGFHGPRVTALLKQRGVPYVMMSPNVSKIEDGSGSAYLSIFSREKTPLEKLFAGEKLFMYPRMNNLGTPPAKDVNDAFAYRENPRLPRHPGRFGDIVKSLFLTIEGAMLMTQGLLIAAVMVAVWRGESLTTLLSLGVVMASIEVMPFGNVSNPFFSRRSIGFAAPLLYFRSKADLGGGDMDVLLQYVWLAKKTRHSIIQLPPLNRSIADNSPYSPGSDYVFEPAYIGTHFFWGLFEPLAMQDPALFARLEERIKAEIGPAGADLRERSKEKAIPEELRALKYRWGRLVFEWFQAVAFNGKTERWAQYVIAENEEAAALSPFLQNDLSPAGRFKAFIDRGRGHDLTDNLLFFLMAGKFGTADVYKWEDAAIRTRRPLAIQHIKQQNKDELLFETFLQWIFQEQLENVETIANSGDWPVGLMLDQPVAPGAASVWIHPEAFQVNPETMKSDVLQGVPGEHAQHWQFTLPNPSHPKAREYLLKRFLFLLEFCAILRIDYFPGYYYTWQLTEDGGDQFTLRKLGIWDWIHNVFTGPGEPPHKRHLIYEIIKNKLRDALPSNIRENVFTSDGELKYGSMVLAARKETGAIPNGEPRKSGWYRQYSSEHAREIGFTPIAPENGYDYLQWIIYLGEASFLRPDDSLRVGFFAPAFGEELVAEFMAFAQREGKTLVGEALGWVHENVRESMRRLRIPGYEVAAFSLNEFDSRKPTVPRDENSLVAPTNFDTPTTKRYFQSRGGNLPQIMKDFFHWVAGSRAPMVIITMLDYFGSEEPVNIPGKTGQWTRRAPVPVEPLLQSADGSTGDTQADEIVALMRDVARHGRRDSVDPQLNGAGKVERLSSPPWALAIALILTALVVSIIYKPAPMTVVLLVLSFAGVVGIVDPGEIMKAQWELDKRKIRPVGSQEIRLPNGETIVIAVPEPQAPVLKNGHDVSPSLNGHVDSSPIAIEQKPRDVLKRGTVIMPNGEIREIFIPEPAVSASKNGHAVDSFHLNGHVDSPSIATMDGEQKPREVVVREVKMPNGEIRQISVPHVPGASGWWHGSKLAFWKIGAIEGAVALILAIAGMTVIANIFPDHSAVIRFIDALVIGVPIVVAFNQVIHKWFGVHLGNDKDVSRDPDIVFTAILRASVSLLGVPFAALAFVVSPLPAAALLIASVLLAAGAHAIRNFPMDLKPQQADAWPDDLKELPLTPEEVRLAKELRRISTSYPFSPDAKLNELNKILTVLNKGLAAFNPARLPAFIDFEKESNVMNPVDLFLRHALSTNSRSFEVRQLESVINAENHQLLIPKSKTLDGIKAEIEKTLELTKDKPGDKLTVYLRNDMRWMRGQLEYWYGKYDRNPDKPYPASKVRVLEELELQTEDDISKLLLDPVKDGQLQLLLHGTDNVPENLINTLLRLSATRYPEKVKLILMNEITANAMAVSINALPDMQALMKFLAIVGTQA